MIQSNFGLDDLREIEETSSRSWSWSDASQDLLQLILKFLTPINHLRFGSVCRSWRIAQRECLHPPAQDLPFYIVRGDTNDYRGESIELYSLTEKKIYKKPLHRHCHFTEKFSIPNSGGWFVLYDLNEEIYFLFNPFIAYGCIDLPRQESIRYNEYRVFFSTTAHPDGLLLLMYTSGNGDKFLQYCRLNPRSDHQYYEWQEPFIVSGWDQEICLFLSSFTFFQGKLYALNEDAYGGLSVVDTLFPHDYTVLKMKLEPPVEWHNVHHAAAIVESCGEMLLVLRVGELMDRIAAVYRANLTELEWVKVENLGDRAILILNQRNSAVSVCTIETDFRSNWVYYFSFFSRERVLVRFIEFKLVRDGVPLFESPTDDEYFSMTDGDYFSMTDVDSDDADDEYGLTLLFPS